MAGNTDSNSRNIFVIMPFVAANNRDESDLESFFLRTIKEPIEASSKLRNEYRVTRSDSDFCITDSIIANLKEAHVVIADLSGKYPNPNVMYELGVRLSISNSPVILIRESHAENKQIFDVKDYFTKSYSPVRPQELSDYLVQKLLRIESGEDLFNSPVLNVLRGKHKTFEEIDREECIHWTDTFISGTHSMHTVFLMSLAVHCQSKGLVVPSSDVTGIDFESLQEQLFLNMQDGAIDFEWKEFGFVPYCHPAMMFYSSRRYLSGLVPEQMVFGLDKHVDELMNTYFLTDYLWKKGISQPELFRYAAMLKIMIGRLKAIKMYMRSGNDSDLQNESLAMHDEVSRTADSINEAHIKLCKESWKNAAGQH